MLKTEVNSELNFQAIKEIYTSGYKTKNELKVGLEYERLPIEQKSFKAVSYEGDSGILRFLRTFAKYENWDYITDEYNIIGLKQGHDTITLEPGCQLEFSLEPKKTIAELELKVNQLNRDMAPILNKYEINLINYGVSPLSTNKNIQLIPKKRYEMMANYLWGILSDVMMRETAGIQATFDFENEEDAIKKFKVANQLTPFMTAMFANSPIRGGVDTGYKSFRALSWLNTDNDRCGFFSNFKDDYNFDDYIETVLDVPMIFINKNNTNIKLNGKINFKEYMLSGYKNHLAEINDYILQSNLCFPEVRLRNFIEIRNHDCGNAKMPFAMLAIYKGILYNPSALNAIEELFANTKFRDFNELRYSVPKTALHSQFLKHSVKDYANEILSIAETSLKEQNNGEEKYLDYIKEFTQKGLTQADVILKNWYGIWNKDISKLIKYIS